MLAHRDPHFYLCRLVDIKWVWCYNTCIEFETQEKQMNERIKELMDQAIEYANQQNTFDPRSEFSKKFAELIVRECIGVAVEQKQWVENQQPTFNYNDDRWDRARIQQSERIIEKIREHFGVEE